MGLFESGVWHNTLADCGLFVEPNSGCLEVSNLIFCIELVEVIPEKSWLPSAFGVPFSRKYMLIRDFGLSNPDPLDARELRCSWLFVLVRETSDLAVFRLFKE